MLAILLLAVLGACTAAPQFGYPSSPYDPGFAPGHYDQGFAPGHYNQGFAPRHYNPDFAPRHYDPLKDEIFDTKQFWGELATEMHQLDTMLANFYKMFPAITSTQEVKDNEYHITIPLAGFDEKEIAVKAREGMLMVQAVHKLEGGGERSYLDVKTLPSCVDVKGSWNYENDLLKIVFPLKPEESETTAPETESPVTESFVEEDSSREQVETQSVDEDKDADVGIRGDQEKGKELFTNEIPRNSVEATTYSVDLKDEVEFVPIRYKK